MTDPTEELGWCVIPLRGAVDQMISLGWFKSQESALEKAWMRLLMWPIQARLDPEAQQSEEEESRFLYEQQREAEVTKNKMWRDDEESDWVLQKVGF